MVILEASIEATSDHLEKLKDVSRCSFTFQRLCTGTTVEYVRYLRYLLVLYTVYQLRYYTLYTGIYCSISTVEGTPTQSGYIYPSRADHTELKAIHTSCLYSCFGFPIPKRAAAILVYRYFCMPALTRTINLYVVLDLGPSNGQILYFQPTRVMRN